MKIHKANKETANKETANKETVNQATASVPLSEDTQQAEPAQSNDAPEISENAEAEVKPQETGESEGATAQYNALLDRYQRSLAEFDNYRKRTNKEKAAMYDEGIRDAVEKLLPIVDNFERALNANENKDDKFYQGVAMIGRQLGSYLTDLGVELIQADEGEHFTPNLHFAVAHLEDEAYGHNVIVDELQKGYKHKDKVIRPSMVRVAN